MSPSRASTRQELQSNDGSQQDPNIPSSYLGSFSVGDGQSPDAHKPQRTRHLTAAAVKAAAATRRHGACEYHRAHKTTCPKGSQGFCVHDDYGKDGNPDFDSKGNPKLAGAQRRRPETLPRANGNPNPAAVQQPKSGRKSRPNRTARNLPQVSSFEPRRLEANSVISRPSLRAFLEHQTPHTFGGCTIGAEPWSIRADGVSLATPLNDKQAYVNRIAAVVEPGSNRHTGRSATQSTVVDNRSSQPVFPSGTDTQSQQSSFVAKVAAFRDERHYGSQRSHESLVVPTQTQNRSGNGIKKNRTQPRRREQVAIAEDRHQVKHDTDPLLHKDMIMEKAVSTATPVRHRYANVSVSEDLSTLAKSTTAPYNVNSSGDSAILWTFSCRTEKEEMSVAQRNDTELPTSEIAASSTCIEDEEMISSGLRDDDKASSLEFQQLFEKPNLPTMNTPHQVNTHCDIDSNLSDVTLRSNTWQQQQYGDVYQHRIDDYASVSNVAALPETPRPIFSVPQDHPQISLVPTPSILGHRKEVDPSPYTHPTASEVSFGETLNEATDSFGDDFRIFRKLQERSQSNSLPKLSSLDTVMEDDLTCLDGFDTHYGQWE